MLVFCLVAGVALSACTTTPPVVNKPPVARISAPATNSVYDTGVTIWFNGSQSRDPENKTLTFFWNFGDGSNATTKEATHAYAAPGKYSVSLEVSDGKKKGTDRIDLNINQANRAPAVKLVASKTSASNEEPVEFNASGTTDADNDSLAFNWSFGDNTTAQGPMVTHTFTVVGSYNIAVNVSDGKTSSKGTVGLAVYQANRPPVLALAARPSVAFIGDAVEFSAAGSTDPDNDSLSAVWLFGDGTNGTGMRVNHTYSLPGNYNATATVSDGKLSRLGGVRVEVLPHAIILVDWNQTDYGYAVKLDADSEAQNLSATVSSSGGATDDATNITALGARDFRVRTAVAPVVGEVLNVAVSYWGHEIANRSMTIYENTPMPGQDCTATMAANMSQHTVVDDGVNWSEEWFNVSGSVNVVVRGSNGDYSMRIAKGSSEKHEKDSDNAATDGLTEVDGWFNQTLVWGASEDENADFSSKGNSTTRAFNGSLMSSIYAEGVQRTQGHNNTFIGQSLKLTQQSVNYTIEVGTLGIEDKANGDGIIFSCLKLKYNVTVEAMIDIGMGQPIHLLQFNDTIQWNVRDDRYENTTIYLEYVQNTYAVNDTSGEWTLMPTNDSSGSRYEDSDGNGKYNPDPAPLSMDELFEFHGPMPRELVVGDRIAGTNSHGVRLELKVTEEGTYHVGAVNYTAVHIEGTFSNAAGNVTGTVDNWVVSEGDLTGLPLQSIESKSWVQSEEKTQTSTSRIELTTVRED